MIVRAKGVLEHWETPLPASVDGARGSGSTRLLSTFGLDGPLAACAVSTDGKRLAAARPGGPLDAFDLSDPRGPRLLGSTMLPSVATRLRLVGPEGRRVVALTLGGEALDWTPGQGDGAVLLAGPKATTIAVTPAGDQVFVGDSGGCVHSFSQGAPTRVLQAPLKDGSVRPVHVLEVSPDGKRLAVGHRKFILRIWPLQDLDAAPKETAYTNFVDFRWQPSSDGLVLMQRGTRGGTFFLVNANTGAKVVPSLGKNVAAHSVAFTADSSLFVAACSNGKGIAFNRLAETVIEFGLHGSAPTLVAASPLKHDPRVLTVDEQGEAYLWTLTPEVTARDYSRLEISQSLRSSFGLGPVDDAQAR